MDNDGFPCLEAGQDFRLLGSLDADAHLALLRAAVLHDPDMAVDHGTCRHQQRILVLAGDDVHFQRQTERKICIVSVLYGREKRAARDRHPA